MSLHHLVLAALVFGCAGPGKQSDHSLGDESARAGSRSDGDEVPDSDAGSSDNGSGTERGGASNGSDGTGDEPGDGDEDPPDAPYEDDGANDDNPLLPARIRRLTNAEYDASVQALLETTATPSVEFSFPPDARQGPTNSPAGPAFTVNDAQRVDPVLADKLDAAAQALVNEARQNGTLARLAPCSDPANAGEACARDFLSSFGARAYRRPLSDAETDFLLSGPSAAYHVGADGYSYEEGIALLMRVMLQTPAFLYITELGENDPPDPIGLTANEVAAQLAYLLTGAPPDQALQQSAADGDLETPQGRESEARRILDTPAGRARSVQVVRQWLGIDSVARREKASSVYPEFSDVSQAMEDESQAFIDEVLHRSTGTLTELLTADWTIADQALAQLYGVPFGGEGQRTSLAGTPRRGILNQGAFLSVFASNNASHPVFRGVALMRRLACLDTPDPGALGIVVSLPPADPSKTTRERFEVHASDSGCAACHSTIDALGFAFESFDGIGKLRETENGHAVDTAVTLSAGTDVDGIYADSTELMAALAQSDLVKACLARQVFRSSAARSNKRVKAAEAAFVDTWKQLPASQQDQLLEVLVAYVKSPSFVQRSPK